MLILFFCPTVALCLVFHILCTQPEYGRNILWSVVRVFPVKAHMDDTVLQGHPLAHGTFSNF